MSKCPETDRSKSKSHEVGSKQIRKERTVENRILKTLNNSSALGGDTSATLVTIESPTGTSEVRISRPSRKPLTHGSTSVGFRDDQGNLVLPESLNEPGTVNFERWDTLKAKSLLKTAAADIRLRRPPSEKTELEQISIAIEQEFYRFKVRSIVLEKLSQHPSVVIAHSETDASSEHSLDVRWRKLDRYAKDNPGASISHFARELFPELEYSTKQKRETLDIAPPPLPERAPKGWPLWPKAKMQESEIPPEFCVRVYGVWMKAGMLSRPDLKAIDPALFSSLDNWLKHNRRKSKPEKLPEGFNLLTLEEKNDAWVDRVRKGDAPLPQNPHDLARFALALRYRQDSYSKK